MPKPLTPEEQEKFETTPLWKLNRRQLQAICRQRGMQGYGNHTREGLIDLITASRSLRGE